MEYARCHQPDMGEPALIKCINSDFERSKSQWPTHARTMTQRRTTSMSGFSKIF